MIGTALLALVLAIGRAWLPGNLPTWSSVLDASGLNRMENVTIFLIFSVVSLIVTLPCIWIALAARKHVLPMAVGWFFYRERLAFWKFR